MKQTAVEWLEEQIKDIFYVAEASEMTKKFKSVYEQAKQMEKEQMIDAIKTEIKLIGNYFDVDKLEQREQGHHIRFTCILKDRFDHYNKTYGGVK
jgi:hypothetical protein